MACVAHLGLYASWIMNTFFGLKFCTTTPGKENFVLVHLIVHKLIETFIVFCCSLISELGWGFFAINMWILQSNWHWLDGSSNTSPLLRLCFCVMPHCFPLETIRPVKLNIDSLSTNRSIKLKNTNARFSTRTKCIVSFFGEDMTKLLSWNIKPYFLTQLSKYLVLMLFYLVFD